jgi:tetratricopeptide (TPR) repeat protein
MVVYYGNLSVGARDRMLRAFALGEAAGAKQVGALSAAWLAHIGYATLDFSSMLHYLNHALKHSTPSQHSAQARASLVAAEALHWAERFDLAAPWYSRARQHASCEGDDSMLSALMHNMAWLRVAECRRRETAGPLGDVAARHAKIGAESITRYDELVGISSLGSFVPMLRAQVLILDKHYDEALALLEANAEAFVQQGLERLDSSVHADMALCRWKCGDLEGAARSAQMAIGKISALTHADDRAMTHARVSEVFRGLGRAREADDQAAMASEALQLHKRKQLALLPALLDALNGL